MSNSAGPKITKDGLVLDFDAANPKSYNFYTDSYASSVSLYLQMNGANGSTTFTDSSPNVITVTAVGNAQISTTQSKYNGSAGYFDGTGDYLSIPDSSAPVLGSSDWTIEAWIYISVAKSFNAIYAKRSPGGYGFGLQVDAAGNLSISASTNGSSWALAGSSLGSGYGVGSWIHVAVVRSGNTITGYKNGVSTGTQTLSGTIWPSTGYVAAVASGLAGDTSQDFNGYIDNLKISSFARYTSNFTSPPIPSTCTDLTRSKNVGTLTGGVDYNFSNGGSLVFNGTSSYITLGTNSNLNFGTGDFTIDCWYNLSATTPNDQGILNDTAGTFSSGSVLFKARQNSSGGKISLQAYDFSSVGGRIVTSSTTIAASTWYNATVTRIGNSFTLYINGRSESTGTFAGSMNFNNNNGTYIGYSILDAANGYLNGRIPNIKIYKARGLTSTEVYNNFVANRGRFGV